MEIYTIRWKPHKFCVKKLKFVRDLSHTKFVWHVVLLEVDTYQKQILLYNFASKVEKNGKKMIFIQYFGYFSKMWSPPPCFCNTLPKNNFTENFWPKHHLTEHRLTECYLIESSFDRTAI
jgi:hypothetical protein